MCINECVCVCVCSSLGCFLLLAVESNLVKRIEGFPMVLVTAYYWYCNTHNIQQYDLVFRAACLRGQSGLEYLAAMRGSVCFGKMPSLWYAWVTETQIHRPQWADFGIKQQLPQVPLHFCIVSIQHIQCGMYNWPVKASSTTTTTPDVVIELHSLISCACILFNTACNSSAEALSLVPGI